MPTAGRSLAVPLVLLSLLIVGCSKEDIEKAVQSVDIPDNIPIPAQVTQALNLAGSMTLNLDAPVSINACYYSLVGMTGRPSVLQFTSYKNIAVETFPSVMLRAEVEGKTAAELAGKTIKTQMFVQSEADGPIWHTASGDSIQLTITEVTEDLLVANVASGSLTNTETQQSITVTGELSCPLKK